MIREFIGGWRVSLIQTKILAKSTDFIIRLCVIKRINTKELKAESISRYRLNMVDELLNVLTHEDLQKYLGLD